MSMNETVISALANPVRLKILKCLGMESKNVNQLVEVCELSQSAVSQHLAKLREAGLVDCEKSGKHMFYKLKFPESASLADMIEGLCNKQNEISKAAEEVVPQNPEQNNAQQESQNNEYINENQQNQQNITSDPPDTDPMNDTTSY